MVKKSEKKNRKINKNITIPIIILAVCAGISLLVWKLQYHGASPDYVSTQKQINENKDKEKKMFNSIKQDSFPTVQQAHDYLVEQTGHKDLSSSSVSLDDIRKLLKDKYGSDAANALLSGLCLSEDMSPDQEAEQEISLAQVDKNQKDYVGFADKSWTTSVYNPSDIESNGTTTFPINVPTAGPSSKLSWSKDGDFSLSNPIALDLSVKTNKKYCTMLVLVKTPLDNDTSFNDFKNEMNSISVKVNGKRLGLSGSHEETKTSEESQGMQYSKSSGAKNNLAVYESNKIFAGSIVPVTFDLPLSSVKENMKVELNGIDQGNYKIKNSENYKF